MSSTLIANTGLLHANDLFIKGPNYVNVTDLGVSSAVTISYPGGGRYLRLSANFDFYVKWGSTGVSTGGAITDGTGSEVVALQSGGVYRDMVSSNATTAISVMSTAACHLTQMWWTA